MEPSFHEQHLFTGRDTDLIDVLLRRSRDGGRTFTAPVEITAQVKRPDWGW